MKTARNAVLALIITLFLCLSAWGETRVFFNPPAPGEKAVANYIVEAINGSQQQILIQQYQFTEPSIVKALVDAQKRGVKETAIFDTTVNTAKKGGDGLRALQAEGVEIFIDPVHIAHNKVLIIDGKLVIGGSFNFSTNANRHNCENCTFIDEPAIVKRFLDNFNRRLQVAKPLEEPE